LRRRPNPWVATPVLVAALAGGLLGFFVTDASCAPGSCRIAAALIGTAVAVVVGGGIGVVTVLALKSLDEFRTHRDREILTITDDEEPKSPE
jgi:hypothetical protein